MLAHKKKNYLVYRAEAVPDSVVCRNNQQFIYSLAAFSEWGNAKTFAGK